MLLHITRASHIPNLLLICLFILSPDILIQDALKIIYGIKML